jgi:hypothetical protein
MRPKRGMRGSTAFAAKELRLKKEEDNNNYEKKNYIAKNKKEDPSHYFRMMKDLTLLGYFTSEIGCTQARRYVETPGKFEGCVPYTKGDKAWA